MTTSIESTKMPGDLVLGECGKLYMVNGEGRHEPHEQPHRREQRLRAEAQDRRIAATFTDKPRRPRLSLFGGAR